MSARNSPLGWYHSQACSYCMLTFVFSLFEILLILFSITLSVQNIMVNWALFLNQKYCSIFWTKPCFSLSHILLVSHSSQWGERVEKHTQRVTEGSDLRGSSGPTSSWKQCYPEPCQAKSDFTVCFLLLYISVKTVMENWWGKQSDSVRLILFIKASYIACNY